MDYTYHELKNQYQALRKTFDYLSSKKDQLIGFYQKSSPQKLTYLGCGSSYFLCQSAELSAEARLGIPATALPAGDLMLNYQSYQKILTGSLLIAPTRSGSTSEVLLAIEKVKTIASVPVLAITCVEKSGLAKMADFTIELPWAFDESVCQTRTVTNLYTANLLILALLCGDQKLIAGIDQAINAGPNYLAKIEPQLVKIAEEDWNKVTVLADGEIQGIAREGALAFTEIARVPGDYYHLLDVRHGPMVLIDHHTLVVVSVSHDGYEQQAALIRDLLEKGATVITYSDLPIDPIAGVKLHIDSGFSLDLAARGIPFILIPQILAYYKAVNKGVDPDQPEGLSAWIKL